jgi:hypothetical protein
MVDIEYAVELSGSYVSKNRNLREQLKVLKSEQDQRVQVVLKSQGLSQKKRLKLMQEVLSQPKTLKEFKAG